MNKPWRLLLTGELYTKLHSHLFPGDGDEHGAVILAGLAETEQDIRLLARELHLASDGNHYVPGIRGYRMLRADFITEKVLQARDERLVYLAVHNHAGNDRVAFSIDDLQSHERGYPALLQITRGTFVGALVLAENAIAGEIWLSDRKRVPLERTIVVGHRRRVLFSMTSFRDARSDPRYERQVRLFGDRGQDILSNAKVSILGLGGIGSILVELVARLGAGRIVVVDPDRVERSNLSRLIGATEYDVAPRFLEGTRRGWLRSIGRLLSRPKTVLARRSIRRANRKAAVWALAMDVVDPDVVDHLKDCDYVFLAADTMRARNVFNALVHQFLIPGVQVGTKIRSDDSGGVKDVYAVARRVTPEAGCLRCSGFIKAGKLQEESLSNEERAAQQYVDDTEVVAPSVITLNALASAQAANDFLFYMTGLAHRAGAMDYMYFRPVKREVSWDHAARRVDCIDCGRHDRSRFAKGDGKPLPVKLRRSSSV